MCLLSEFNEIIDKMDIAHDVNMTQHCKKSLHFKKVH